MMNFGAWDIQLFFALNNFAGRSASLDALIVFVASYLPYLVVALLAWRLYKDRRFPLLQKAYVFALALAAALVARIGIGSPIRFFFPRPRPFLSYHVHQLIAEHAPSFPSGHALFFFGFSMVAFAYDRKLGILCLVLSTFIVLARVAAGIHYPSDIIAGAVLGSLCGVAAWYVGRRMHILPAR